MISTKNPAHEIRCLLIESLSVQRGNRNYFMKSSDGITENAVSLKMLKYNSCKIQSYGISWSLKCNVVLGNCSAEVTTVRKRGVFGSIAWFRLWLTAGHVSRVTEIWVKKSVTWEMHGVLRLWIWTLFRQKNWQEHSSDIAGRIWFQRKGQGRQGIVEDLIHCRPSAKSVVPLKVYLRRDKVAGQSGEWAEPGKGQGDSAVLIFLGLFLTIQIYFCWMLLALFCPWW